MNTLEADSVIYDFGSNRVLSDIYLKCCQGELVGILGRNGAGKSTLFNIIFGSRATENRSIRINGVSVSEGYTSGITSLPQSGLIPNNMSVSCALDLFKIDRAIFERYYPDAGVIYDKRSVEFSGGERRFIELLLILLSPSKFSLLDEPFSGLSPVMIERAVIIMDEVKRNKGILLTDHLHRYVTSCADRLYILTQGRLRVIRNPEELSVYGYLNA